MSKWEFIAKIRQRVKAEQGTLRKASSLRVALCYPAPYSVGMSSLGYQTIYREIHLHPEASAERFFLPDEPVDYAQNQTPLFSYENETPLSDFPLVAFSIAYELELPGIFEILKLGGIPLLRQDRTEKHPLILAGGPLTNSNPEPLAPFVDLILLGEGEDLIHEFLDASLRMNRDELLSYFSSRCGFYAPGITPEIPAIAKAEDSRLPAFSQILTPDTVLHSMFLIEPERGCSRGCAYCVMRRTTNGGMRLVAPERLISLIPENARRVGLVGAAVTDHPKINEIVRAIVSDGREIGISSLRADRLNEELVLLLAKGGYRTLTTASDGASERLRSKVDRRTEEHHLIRAAELTKRAGLQRLKLYQMIGLPDETIEDIDELIRFALELAKITSVSVSIAPFVAKRNTPLNGAPFEPIAKIDEKLSKIRAGLKEKVEVKPSSARWAWVEYMLAQSDESAGMAAMDAWRAGGGFSAWKRAFQKRDVQPFGRNSKNLDSRDNKSEKN
jgi:radical SAM superfamily enzyme YgiQ (UPF0313 family)